jgi:hypothetical protein
MPHERHGRSNCLNFLLINSTAPNFIDDAAKYPDNIINKGMWKAYITLKQTEFSKSG